MTDQEKPEKKSEDEIDEIVISHTDDPDAWEAPVKVTRRHRKWHVRPDRIELAAKYYVLSVLHRLGTDAVFAHHQDVDIAIVREPGVALTVDVKALTGSNNWRVDNFRSDSHHFLVFVCYLTALQDPHAAPDVYVLRSDELRNVLAHRHEDIVSVEELGRQLSAKEAWHHLLSQPAT